MNIVYHISHLDKVAIYKQAFCIIINGMKHRPVIFYDSICDIGNENINSVPTPSVLIILMFSL